MSDSHKDGALAVRTEGRMHPMVEAAISGGAAPETLEKMMDLQERWERGQSKRAYTDALVDLKRDLPAVIARDQTVSYSSTKYTHASLAAAVEAVTGILVQHGFSATWHPGTSERDVSVTCRLQHREGHCEETTMTAPPDNSGHKNPAQAKMSTVTLLSRYTLLSMLGIATADMKDPEPREPTAADKNKVDQSRNVKCAAWLSDRGKTRAQAEARTGHKMPDWTSADLDNLREWGKKKDDKQPTVPDGYELDPNTGELIPLPGAED